MQFDLESVARLRSLKNLSFLSYWSLVVQGLTGKLHNCYWLCLVWLANRWNRFFIKSACETLFV